MFALTSSHRFYLYNGICDMRKSFDGLCGLISSEMQSDPVNGHVYLFLNRRLDRLKLLVWDTDGFVLYYKRLEKGTFERPNSAESTTATHLNWQSLVLMLGGYSINQKKVRKRYNLKT